MNKLIALDSHDTEKVDITCPFCGNESSAYKIGAVGKSRIIACRNCTNAWTDPPPGRVSYESEDFHGQFKYKSIEDLPQQWRNALIKQIKAIKCGLIPGARVLEIGCGQGILLAELTKEGFHVVGIEPSASGSTIASEKGLDVINDDFPSKKIKGQTYDLVILSQVLEHIKDVNLFIDEILAILSKSGKILFVQTNWKGLMPRFYKSSWYAWVPEQHYWHFTPKGLSYILERKGCQVEKIEFYSLEHNNHILSRFTKIIPSLADQFHMLVKYDYPQ